MPLNPLYRLLLIINLYIYSFYQKWDNEPKAQAINVVGLLLFFNLLEIDMLVNGLPKAPLKRVVLGGTLIPAPFQYHLYLLPIFFSLMLINYFLVYHRRKHEELFFRLSHESRYVIHRDFYIFWLYFLLTVIPIGGMVVQKLALKP